MGRRSSSCSKTDRFVFSQRWFCAVESDVATRNRDYVAQRLCSSKHNPLDQVNQHRRSCWWCSVVWTFQTDQLEAVSQRLSRIHLPLYKIWASRDRPARARSSVSG